MTGLLRQELGPDNMDELERSSQEFADFSIGLRRIWSFVEGQETTLILRDTKDSSELPRVVTTANRMAKLRTATFFKTPVSTLFGFRTSPDPEADSGPALGYSQHSRP